MKADQKEREKASNPVEAFLRKTYAPTTSTRQTYRKLLSLFFKAAGVSAEEFVRLVRENPDEAEKLCFNTMDALIEEERYTSKTIASMRAALNQFLEYLKAPFRIKLRGLKAVPESFDYIPSIQEIELLIAKARIEVKPIIALIAFSGIRPCDIFKLRFENIAEDIEFDEEEKVYRVKRLPAKIVVPQKKTGRPYVTFMGPKCANVMITYLNWLIVDSLKPLSPKSKLFPTITYNAFRSSFFRLVKSCGIKVPPVKHFRPYSLRKYFRQRLMMAGIDSDLAEYLMGHKRGISSLTAVYAGLRDLDDRAIEDLRKKFAKALPVLEGVTFTPQEYFREMESEVEKLRKELEWTKHRLEIVLKAIESSFSYLSKNDVAKVWRFIGDLIYREYKEDLRAEYEEMARMVAKISKPKIVVAKGEGELVKYLNMGYEFIKKISNNQYILRAPQ